MSELRDCGIMAEEKYIKHSAEFRKKGELREIKGIWKGDKLVGCKFVYKSFRKKLKEDIKIILRRPTLKLERERK